MRPTESFSLQAPFFMLPGGVPLGCRPHAQGAERCVCFKCPVCTSAADDMLFSNALDTREERLST